MNLIKNFKILLLMLYMSIFTSKCLSMSIILNNKSLHSDLNYKFKLNNMNIYNSTTNLIVHSNTQSITLLTLISAHYTKILTGIILYSLTIWTIIGNIFVCIAIFTNKQLKQGGMSNFLIGNLAISDLLLGLTVLPFSATLSTFKKWVFGAFLCDLWLMIDVLCSTASIWGLLVIALDRYIATNHPIRYRKQKNSIKIAILYCTCSWILSIIVSLGPLLIRGTNETKKFGLRQIENSLNYECILFQTPSFVIISSLFSFYLPLVLMFILYTGVFLKIRQQTKMFNRKKSNKKTLNNNNNNNHIKANIEENEMCIKHELINQTNNDNHDDKVNKTLAKDKRTYFLKRPMSLSGHTNHNSEAKITKILAIIMGAFVACYLPFFIVYIIRSQLNDPNSVPSKYMDIFLWLGYSNSALNPILYAILNHNFRDAFSDLLPCKCFNKNKNKNLNKINTKPNTTSLIKKQDINLKQTNNNFLNDMNNKDNLKLSVKRTHLK